MKMKTKQFLYSWLVLLPAFAFIPESSAQNQIDITETVSVYELPGKTHFYSEKFGDNMYFSLGAGMQTFFTDHYTTATHSTRPKITLALDAAVGKWFSPYWGLRLNFMGGSLHSAWPLQANVMNHIRYFAVYGDFTVNMSNLIAGYNEDRVFSVIPFAGVGYSWAFKNTGTNSKTSAFPVSGGLKLNFRLSHYLDFFLEGRANILADNFGGIVGGEPVESVLSAVGGFSVKFGTNRFKAFDPYGEQELINDLNRKVNGLRAQLEECESRECPPCPETVVVVDETSVVPAEQTLTSAVRFTINSAQISNEEEINVYNIAAWMKANEDFNITIAGYADKDTGTPAYNKQLSEKRAHNVKEMLVNKYGIDPNRIQTIGNGSETQPYGTNSWNRVVIFIGEAAQ